MYLFFFSNGLADINFFLLTKCQADEREEQFFYLSTFSQPYFIIFYLREGWSRRRVILLASL